MDFLVIDDDKTFRDATCLLIDSEGHYAEAACSGELGLTELKEGKFDAGTTGSNLGRRTAWIFLSKFSTPAQFAGDHFTAQGSVKKMRWKPCGAGRLIFWKSVHPRTVSPGSRAPCSASPTQPEHRAVRREIQDSNAQSPEILLSRARHS